MPLVTVPWSPNGLPIATTRSPISSDSDEPSSSGVTPLGMLSSLSTATSADASAPTTLAPTSSPFGNRTVTLVALSTTCWFVRTWPSVVDHEAAAGGTAAATLTRRDER